MVRIPAGTTDLPLIQIVQTGSDVHPASCSTGTVKWQGGDDDHPPPSVAEVKDE